MNKFIKVSKIVLNILLTTILIVGIIFIALFIIGIEPFVVETGSMKPAIQPGSLSFINKHIKYEEIKENDIIAFKIPTGSRVTHRVISVTDKGLETKGDANETSDGVSTTKNNYIGKNIFSIPKLGYVVKLMQTVKGKIILITIIVILLISSFLIGKPKKGKRFKE